MFWLVDFLSTRLFGTRLFGTRLFGTRLFVIESFFFRVDLFFWGGGDFF